MLHYYLARIRKYVVHHRPTATATVVAVMIALVYGMVGFHFLEDKSWPDALYWTVTTMSTVGYGDLSPGTPLGRIHAMFLMVMGIGIFGLVVEGFMSVLLEASEKRKSGLIKVKDKNHILICGWSETIRECLEELTAMKEEVYLLASDQSIRQEIEKIDREITYVQGDPTRWEDLERAGAARAGMIIVDLETDSQSLDCLITLRDRTEARIVVEVERQENQQKFRRAGADELTIPFVLSGRLLAQSRKKRFLSRFVTEVVSTNVGMSLEEVAIEDGGELVGKSLKDLAGAEYLPDYQILAVGRGDRLLVDTRGELKLAAGDRLICLTETVNAE